MQEDNEESTIHYSLENLCGYPFLMHALAIHLNKEWPKSDLDWFHILTNRFHVDSFPQTWVLLDQSFNIFGALCLLPNTMAPKSLQDFQIPSLKAESKTDLTEEFIIWIDSMWIHPDFRNQGFATLMIQQLIKQLNTEYFKFVSNNICLKAHTTNADNIFLKNSFLEYNDSKNFFNAKTVNSLKEGVNDMIEGRSYYLNIKRI